MLDTDDLVHALECADGAAVKPIVSAFGKDVQAADGGINRQRLGKRVFSDQASRLRLNEIVHPLVLAELKRWLVEPCSKGREGPPDPPQSGNQAASPLAAAADGSNGTALPEEALAPPPDSQSGTGMPVILGRDAHATGGGAGSSDIKVAIIPLLFEVGWDVGWDSVVCVACAEAEQMRRLQVRGLSEADARARLAAQLPLAEKVRRATRVVWNDGSLEALQREAVRLMEEWLEKKT